MSPDLAPVPPSGWALQERRTPDDPPWVRLARWPTAPATRGLFLLADGTPVDVRVLARRDPAPSFPARDAPPPATPLEGAHGYQSKGP